MSEENQLLNALVSDYLSKVSPGIAKKFKVVSLVFEYFL